MTSAALKNRPEFLSAIPEKMEFGPNEKKIILTDKITDAHIHIKEGCDLTFVALVNEGWDEKRVLNFHFDGPDSTLNFLALIIGKNQENFPFETISTHTCERTNAYYFVRTALFDQSKVNYRGNLVIQKGAQLTDSYLAHHTLMLSNKAKTETEPCLEIEADDVKAGHAATIGRVDDELLFYLASRGIDKKAGQEMLIQGFLESDFDKIENEEIKTLLVSEIENSC